MVVYEEELKQNYLSIADYVVFVLMLVISAVIGIVFAITGGKQKTVGEYLMANRKMGLLPVTLSLLASFMSAITLLGTPAEIYIHGTQYMLIGFSYIFVMLFSAHVFLPVFYNLQLTSTYEYLEIRFHPLCRIAGTITFLVQMVIYMGIALYAPALALNAVTGIKWWVCVLALGVVVTFYTTLGGMKAVMWTDVFQLSIMFAGMAAILIQSSIDFGGFSKITDAMYRGERLQWFNFDPDPTVRTSVWSIIIGSAFTWLTVYGTNQAMIQRYMCSKSLLQAQIAIWLNFFGLVGLMVLCALCGFVVFANYEGCDPMKLGRIEKADQVYRILPLYVMDKMSHLKGFAGLFIATIFSGALSTVSSGVNALAAVCFEDIYRPIQKHFAPNKNDKKETKNDDGLSSVASKVIALCFALMALAMAFAASKMGDTLQAALGLFGMLGGPLLGVFFMGMTMPFVNWQGALAGHLVGEVFSLWIGFGSLIFKYKSYKPPLSISNCTIANVTTTTVMMSSTTTTTTTIMTNITEAPYAGLAIYKMSYLWQGALAFAIAVLVGCVVSVFSGFQKSENLRGDVISPVVRKLYMLLPKKCRRYDSIERYEESKENESSGNKISPGRSRADSDSYKVSRF